MRSITIKNIPDDLYKKIKMTAQENRRSINNEIINRLDKSLRCTKIDANSFLRRFEHFQNSLEIPPLTDDLILTAKEGGRS
ncbi:MAG: Arc family DNA-binding protein [Deltaproteobacteria bacterium]|nr:Arc family DNA-binding protein [Deltaproteobacteria bacterium]